MNVDTIGVGVLTFKADETGRRDVYDRTLASLCDAKRHSHGSLDLGFAVFDNSAGPNTTVGHGMQKAIELAIHDFHPDVVVLSNDDVEWQPDAFERIAAFWRDAPERIIICGGYIEPEYPWSKVLARRTIGGQPTLIRATVPGHSWTFRARDWPTIGPVPQEQLEVCDLPVCKRLRVAGRQLAQIDVCTHIGGDLSVWGNAAHNWDYPTPQMEAAQ